MVFLVLLTYLNSLTPIVDKRKDLREVRWTIELYIPQRVVVCLLYSFNGIAFWCESVSIQCKVVEGNTRHGSGKLGPKSICWNQLILIIVLQHTTD